MWKLYASHQQSVAVRSRYNLLSEALPSECFLGCVQYIDYRRSIIPVGNAFNYINCKRLSFAHEHELRAAVWDPTILQKALTPEGPVHVELEPGRIFPVDISKLITEVYVSPNSDGLLFQVVEHECHEYGLSVPVLRSGVNAPPAY
jgi:hypothetical protein